MFKNKKFEVKMVDDKPQAVIPQPPKPRLTNEDKELVAGGAKMVAGVIVLLKVLDCATEIIVKKL